MSMVERLKSYMEHIGMASTQFADEANIPRPTISQILNGRNRKISNEVIEKLHIGFPTLNMMWLLFGDGEMETTPNIKISEPQNTPISTNTTAQPTANQPFADPRLFASAPQIGLQASNINQFVNDTLRQRYGEASNATSYQPQGGVGTMNTPTDGMTTNYGGTLPPASAQGTPSPVMPGNAPAGMPGNGSTGPTGAAPISEQTLPAKSGDKRISYILVFYNDSTFEVLAPTTTPIQ